MERAAQDARLVRRADLHDYFRREVHAVMHATEIDAQEGTVHYLANLLARFTRAERLFERTPDGVMIRPLAESYADAVRAETPARRYRALRRTGDVALFIACVLPESLRRKPVDVDYYVAMGEGAYGYLSTAGTAERDAEEVTRDTFSELATKFVAFADVLAAVSDVEPSDDRDLLRAYEVWLKTGSRRAERQLRRAGIEPLRGSNSSARRH
jgi:hypothetical protein